MSEKNRLKTERRIDRKEHLARVVSRVHEKLDAWNAFTEAMNVPSEFYPALQTGRTELLKLVQARPLTADECQQVFNMIRILIETNQALQAHASELANQVEIWAEQWKGLYRKVDEIKAFAQFETPVDELDEVGT